MRKWIVCFLSVIGILSYGINVNAQEYKVMELIPVDSAATVTTERFLYSDFVYNSNLDSKGNNVINFNSIKNISDSKASVGINILLFDENKKNIGYVTYCSKKDLDSDYYDYQLSPQQDSSFSVRVTKKYFANGDDLAASAVKYISVYDDNKYCHIGGYAKYEGLTIEEISGGAVTYTTSEGEKISSDVVDLLFNSIGKLIFVVIGILLVSLIVCGVILNALYKRMYAKTTPMAYIPLLNNYIAVKMAFGEMVGKFYLVGFCLGFVLAFVGINILAMAVSFLSIVSFVVVIIKLITKKYDLFYYEPSIKNSANLKNNMDKASNNSVNVINNTASNNNFFNGQVPESLEEEVNKEDIVDLNYNDVNNDFSNSFMNNNYGSQMNDVQNTPDNSSISSGGLSSDNNFDMNVGNTANSNNNSTSDNGGESDLSKFFK